MIRNGHFDLRRAGMSLLLAAVVPLAWAGDAGLQFTHHDWTLACDNTLACRAAGYQRDGDALAVSVLLTRPAGAGTAVTGRVMLGQYEESPLPAGLALQIDGRDEGAVDLDVREGHAPLAPAQVAVLVEALARDADIAFVGDDGQRWQLSDRGGAAVMLKMDEIQGRLGTPGALLRKGERDEAGVLPPRPAPSIRVAPLEPPRPDDHALLADPRLRGTLQASLSGEDCEGLQPGQWDESWGLVRLDDAHVLVSVRCWMAAYNEGYGYWVTNDAPPYRPRLVTTSGSWSDGAIIDASQKGRGLGDCWWHASWAWDGREFVQASEYTTGMCRLVAAGGAWVLPTLVTELVQ